jgi:hypothetical protein
MYFDERNCHEMSNKWWNGCDQIINIIFNLVHRLCNIINLRIPFLIFWKMLLFAVQLKNKLSWNWLFKR